MADYDTESSESSESGGRSSRRSIKRTMSQKRLDHKEHMENQTEREVSMIAANRTSVHHDTLLAYWKHYKEKIVKMFEKHYPRKDVEFMGFVDYPKFKNWVLVRLAATMFDKLLGSGFLDLPNSKNKKVKVHRIKINFSNTLAFVLVSSGLEKDEDTGEIYDSVTDPAKDIIGHVSKLEIVYPLPK